MKKPQLVSLCDLWPHRRHTADWNFLQRLCFCMCVCSSNKEQLVRRAVTTGQVTHPDRRHQSHAITDTRRRTRNCRINTVLIFYPADLHSSLLRVCPGWSSGRVAWRGTSTLRRCWVAQCWFLGETLTMTRLSATEPSVFLQTSWRMISVRTSVT